MVWSRGNDRRVLGGSGEQIRSPIVFFCLFVFTLEWVWSLPPRPWPSTPNHSLLLENIVMVLNNQYGLNQGVCKGDGEK